MNQTITTEPEPFSPEAGEHCFHVDPAFFVEGHGYRASVVFENISGHFPTGTWPYEGQRGQVLPYFWGPTLKEAQAQAESVNARRGITKERASEIVGKSMGLG